MPSSGLTLSRLRFRDALMEEELMVMKRYHKKYTM